MMSFQTRFIRNSDPFATQSLPKPFYAPSSLKDVDKREAIRSPGRKLVTKRSLAEERFLLGSNTYRTSALPDVKSLGNTGDVDPEESMLKSSVESGKLRECWTGSDESRDTSKVSETTALSDGEPLSVSATQDDIELVKNSLQPLSSAGKSSHHEEKTESVLQRYIDRFRNSAPKSREERVRERSVQKRDFWWLEKSSPNEDIMKPEKECSTLNPESSNNSKLTREALLAMDEETVMLQKKADMLLCQSERSFASSGPIVSTVGLASSGVSDYSSGIEEQIPYRPNFVTIQEKMSKPREFPPLKSRNVSRKSNVMENKQQQQGCGDILSRWRLRRKMEDTDRHASGGSTKQSSKQSHLDPTLEEFRKKLFQQKAAIIKHDIDFERQKMKLLLDDPDEIPSKNTEIYKPVGSESPASQSVPSDPVLTRLRQVTQDLTFQKNGSPQKDAYDRENDNYNNTKKHSVNDAGVENYDTVLLNVNSRENHAGDARFDSIPQSGKVVVDAFQSQVVCDPQEKSFSLYSIPESISATSLKSQVSSENGRKGEDSECKNSKSMKDNYCDYVNEFREPAVLDKVNENVKLKLSRKDISLSDNPFHQVLEAEKPNDEHTASNDTDSDTEIGHSINSSNVTCVDAGNSSDKSNTGFKESDREDFSPMRCEDSPKVYHETQMGQQSHEPNINKKTEYGSTKKNNSKTFSRGTVKASNTSKTKPDKCNNALELQESEQVSQLPTIQPSGSPVPRRGEKPVMQAAIGEAIAEHLFDSSAMVSSVDSWASMFPQSPARSRSLHDTGLLSPSPKRQTPLQSTPITKEKTLIEVPEDSGDSSSDGEFPDDPLLIVLRQQRNLHLKKLRHIADKLQNI